MFNQATSASSWSGNIALWYENVTEISTMNIMSSWISFGNAINESSSVGGLNLHVSPSCYNVKVHIHNTTFRKNMGGNMLLELNGFAHNIITITDSHFEGGYNSEAGGGMYTYTTYNPPHIFHYVQSSRVTVHQ